MADLDIQPPAFHGLLGNEYGAARLRRFLQTTLGDREGVLRFADLAVAPSSPAAMSVVVAPGRGIVNGDEVVRQGAYLLESATSTTLTIAANATGNSRIDLIVLRDYDAATDGGSAVADKGTLEVVQGTPASSPTVPSVPSSAIALAQVTVAAGASSIVAANIRDRRLPLLIRPAAASAMLYRTSAQAFADGAQVTLPTTYLDTFGIADAANSRMNLLPQEPAAGLWEVKGSVAPQTPPAAAWSFGLQTDGVDHISSARFGGRVTNDNPGAVEANGSAFLITEAWSAGEIAAGTASRFVRLIINHAEGTFTVAKASLSAVYLGAIA